MTDPFLGLNWPTWGGLAVLSWLGVFASSWFGLLRAWTVPEDPASLWVPGVGLGFMALANGLPGAAVLSPSMRGRFLGIPEAAALSSMTFSAAAGIGGVFAASVSGGQDTWVVGTGVIIGITAFPLTFGVVFPMAIPLLCSLVVWSLAGRNGGMSGRAYACLTALSALGWSLVALVGAALGVA